MRRNFFRVFLVVLVGLCSPALQQRVQTAASGPARTKTHMAAVGAIAALPLTFEANEGQSDPRVKFLSHAGGDTLFLASSEAVLALRGRETDSRGAVLRMRFVGANADARMHGVDKLRGRTNYLIGNDRTKWRTNVATYQKVAYERIYPGIDAVYYGNPRQLEYDFVVAPGADPGRIRMAIDGAGRVALDSQGNVVLRAGDREVRLQRPVVYQTIDGKRHEISGGYTVTRHQVRVRIGAYDHRRPLVIDPVLAYSTYLGGSSAIGDYGAAIAVDLAGDAYVTGTTTSSDFPIHSAYDGTFPGTPGTTAVAFVTKIDPAQSGPDSLIYSTFLGGAGPTNGWGIAVDDASGNAYVTGDTVSTGYTDSQNFPFTASAFQTHSNGGVDAFMTELDATGSHLVYSTYFGAIGDERGFGIALDKSGDAYITGMTVGSTGSTPDLRYQLPTTPAPSCNRPPQTVVQPTAQNGTGTGFVAKFDPKQSGSCSLIYATYLGGSGADRALGIAVDAQGDAYVTGHTNSSDFPTPNAVQPKICGGCAKGLNGFAPDAFVTKLDPTATAFVYSTYLGGSEPDFGLGIAVDAAGNAYVTGYTGSTPSSQVGFPITIANAFQTISTADAAFITKINAGGNAIQYSTYFGNRQTVGGAIGVDAAGRAFVAGYTIDSTLPLRDPVQSTLRGSSNAFVAAFDLLQSGSASLVYSTYLGGSVAERGDGVLSSVGRAGLAVDAAGNAYVTGGTYSPPPDFTITTKTPSSTAAYQPQLHGVRNAFVAKIAETSATCSLTGVPGAWVPTGSMAIGRHANVSTATRLADGRVLVAGGVDAAGVAVASTETYDPRTGIFASAGIMTLPRAGHTATLLPDGRVLIAGGTTNEVNECAHSAELFDPSANSGAGSFTRAASMTDSRAHHTATLLTDGRILLAGSQGAPCTGAASAEIFDSAANGGVGGFVGAGAIDPRDQHTATLLGDGTVLLVAGRDPTTGQTLASATIFDPSAGAGAGGWVSTGSLAEPRFGHRATRLPSGRVLVTGGIDPAIGLLARAEIFDPATRTFAPGPSAIAPRATHAAALLANGQVLIAGGGGTIAGAAAPLDSAELFDETAAGGTGAFVATTRMSARRLFPLAALLANGSVLVAGGGVIAPATVLTSAEVYVPNNCTPFNTAPGTNVVVKPTDTATGQQSVTVTFSDVTQEGITSATTTTTGPPLPPNFTLGGAGYYHIETTASFSGSVAICIDYSHTPLKGTMVQPPFKHFDSALGIWTPVTVTSWDQANNIICGTVSSLSPFALFVPVDTTPPTITISVTPSSLWPPNGKMIDVTVRGTITDAGSGVDASTARFAVADTYGQAQPSGPVSIAADGSYAVTIVLPASRKGTDLGGRTYTITVRSSDRAGNAASTSAVVTVPHDQSK